MHVEIEELSADELQARAEALARELLHVDWKTALERIDAGELAGTYAEFKLSRLRGLIESG
ncbi:MAG TPA: hypothetical protein VFF73_20965 [Planctomycetota bacterium]|nr:hypothetical protein [Planctomycetota bacterium]